MTPETTKQFSSSVTTMLGVAILFALLSLLARSVLAAIMPTSPKMLSLVTPPEVLPAIITNQLTWPPLTNTMLLMTGQTNLVLVTNASQVTQRIAITNWYERMAAVSNYTVWSSTNALATTTGTNALVSFRRGVSQKFSLRANLRDGQSLGYGTFEFPAETNLAMVWLTLQNSTNLIAWRDSERFSCFVTTTNPLEAFRVKLGIEPLQTNTTLTFFQNSVILTNR